MSLPWELDLNWPALRFAVPSFNFTYETDLLWQQKVSYSRIGDLNNLDEHCLVDSVGHKVSLRSACPAPDVSRTLRLAARFLNAAGILDFQIPIEFRHSIDHGIIAVDELRQLILADFDRHCDIWDDIGDEELEQSVKSAASHRDLIALFGPGLGNSTE